MAKTFLVIGDGIAGSSAAERLRKENEDIDITVLTDEPRPLYDRIQIKEYAKDKMSEDQVTLHDQEWYNERDIDLRLDTRVEEIDPEMQKVTTAEGEEIEYERLLVATGGSPRKLPVPNSDADGIKEFWTFEDAHEIKTRLKASDSAVIVGAGLLGIDFAAAAASHELDEAKYLMRGDRWWRYGLDMEGAEIVHQALRDRGVEPIFNTGVERFEIDDENRVSGVKDSNGCVWNADFVGVAVGLDYNTGLLEGTSVRVEEGIYVDECMRTDENRIYAAGDIAKYPDFITEKREQNGSWGSAQKQGVKAAETMLFDAGLAEEPEPFRWIPSYTITHFDFMFLSFGHPTAGDTAVSRKYSATDYRRLVFKKGRLVGGVLIGDIRMQPRYKKIIKSEERMENRKNTLLGKDFDVDELLKAS